MAFFGQGDEQLNIVIRAVNQTSKALADVEKDVRRSARQMEDLGKNMTFFLTAPLAAGAVGFTKAASDLEESINAVNVVFGEGADIVHQFGENSAQAAGLSTAAFNQLSAQIGALLVDTGMPLDEIARKTNQLTVAAADAASVMNKDVSEALFAFGAAIRGETEPIRAFTGDVTDATLKQYALSQGITKSVTSMNEQEKRILRMEVIFQQMEKFAGDFANTSDGMANSTRIATAEFVNMSARLGRELMPIATDLVTAAGDLIEKINGMSDTTRKAVVVFGTFIASLGPSIFVFGKATTAVVAINSALRTYRTVALAARAATLAMLGPWGLAIAAAGAVATVVGVKLFDSNKAAAESSGELGTEIANLEQSLKDTDPALDAAAAGIQGIGKEAEEATKKLVELRQEALDEMKRFGEDEKDAKRRIAEAIIDQEEKVSRIKEELRELERREDDAESAEEATRLRREMRDLEDKLAREREALRNAAEFKKRLPEEIAEARRRAELTEFERTIEDLMKERIARMKEHIATLSRIAGERDAALAKDAAIKQSFIDTQDAIQEKATETAEHQKVQFGIMVEDAFAAAASIAKAFNTKTTTPAFPSGLSREHGGIVPGPLGAPVPIMAHGQERIIPASRSGSSGGNTFIVTINNPTVRNRADVELIKEQVRDVFRSVVRDNKLQTL